jgi:peptidoglycan glycosyltransferase
MFVLSIFFVLLQFNLLEYFADSPLERYPAVLSLIYFGGIVFIAALLFLLVIFNFGSKKSASTAEPNAGLPDEVRRRLGATAANRALWFFRFVFVALALLVFGFHVYWAMYAAQKDARFAKLEQRDIRNKRVARANLRGWILDRSGDLTKAFASWRVVKKNINGKTVEKLERNYSLDTEMSHLLGTEIGVPGLERTLFNRKDFDPTPEAIDVALTIKKPKDEIRDIKLSIDYELQKFAYQELDNWYAKNKTHGAIVVLNPQTGDVLALASNPTYSITAAQDRDKFHELEANTMDKPLVSRAMHEYYSAGSTFKTFTMFAAYRAGKQNLTFVPQAGGFRLPGGYRPIPDAGGGGCEKCGETIDIATAYEFSSNQYFSWLATQLGQDRLRETAPLCGIKPLDDPADVKNLIFHPQSDIWNAGNNDIKGALALSQSAIVTAKFGKNFTLYDLAIQGMGQGLAAQQTPIQMAMLASIAANNGGNLMKLKIEAEQQPEVYANVISPETAAHIRQDIMTRVIYGASGTATAVANLVGAGMGADSGNNRVGGKTGTAQRGKVFVYNPKTGKPETYTVKQRDQKTGEIREIVKYKLKDRVDGWFLAVAPVGNPKLAIAVVVEDIGNRYGGGTAAPIAAEIIKKARELGLLGDELRLNSASTTNVKQPRRRR